MQRGSVGVVLKHLMYVAGLRDSWLGAVILLASASGQTVELGPAPIAPPESKAAAATTVMPLATGSWTDTSNREAVRSSFASVFVPSAGAAMGWTGAITGCDAGSTSAGYRAAVATRVNWFRSMAGVPASVTLDDSVHPAGQQGALMLSANRQLSHNPPANWICYTGSGAEALSKSNICYAYGTFNDPGCVALYIKDHGGSNAAAGHRRWILNPPAQTMGTGDVSQTGSSSGAYPTTNALRVIQSSWPPRPATREEFVAWPPKGYVPYQVVYPRWSFSFPDANFTNSTVAMYSGGQLLPVRLETVTNGYGENTIVWVPNGLDSNDMNASWPRPPGDMDIEVSVFNVVIGGVSRNFVYHVIVFDPDSETLPGAVSNPSPANGATGIGVNAGLSWSPGSGATSYDVYFGTAAAPPFAGNTASTGYSQGQMNSSTTYYWRVVSKNGGGSTTSATWSFTTQAGLPAAPVLVLPADGATTGIAPAMSWNTAAGATSYDVYFGTSASPPYVTNTAGTSYSPGTLSAGATYYWRVAARNGAGSTTSGVRWFRTAAAVAPSNAPRDFRALGRSDVLLYSPSTGDGYTGLSDGAGGFSYTYQAYLAGFTHLRSGRFFAGDGRWGMAVYNRNNGFGYIGASDGAGRFTYGSLFWSPGYDSVATGDLNGDGLTDVVLRMNDGTAYTGLSNGNGTFTYRYRLVSPGYTHMFVADFSGDGRADLLLYRNTDGLAHLGISDGSGDFTFVNVAIDAAFDHVEVGDVNGDGKTDVLFYYSGNGVAKFGLATGTGFTFRTMSWTPGFTAVRLFDFNGDGKSDVALYNGVNANGYLGIADASANFSMSGLYFGPAWDRIVTQDLNGDGKVDVMVYKSTDGIMYTGISSGNPAAPFTFRVGLWGPGKALAQ